MMIPLLFHRAFMAFACACYTALLPTYFIRRNKFPITQRLPMIVLLEVSVLITASLLEARTFGSMVFNNCIAELLVMTGLMHLVSVTITLRLSWLFLKNFFTKTLVRTSEERRRNDSTGSNVSKSSSSCCRMSESFLIALSKVITVKQMCIMLVSVPLCFGVLDFTFILTSLDAGETCATIILQTTVIKTTALGFLVVLVMTAASSMNIDDNFGTRSEFRALLVPLCALMVLCIMNAAGVGCIDWSFVLSGVCLPAMVLIELLYPLILSFKHQYKHLQEEKRRKLLLQQQQKSSRRRSAKSTHEVQEMMIGVLSETVARCEFLKFMESEFAAENILFYEDCTRFEATAASQGPAAQVTLLEAEYMYHTYILMSSPSCINISHGTRTALIQQLQPLYEAVCKGAQQQQQLAEQGFMVDPEVFTDAKHEVLNMMAGDSFQRYRLGRTAVAAASLSGQELC
eukprot:TRINITY_DN322_c0_g1_i2.p1 TRINITY_DN322_c0_g1~~TRINITY_DN322_c0_g1_i2.p1  ORF type:complete len:458 (+),score=74.15 TRINITY_DN322_c0_g1_i2:60-1433(+)